MSAELGGMGTADNPRKLMAKNRQSLTHKSVHFHLKIILCLLLTIFPITYMSTVVAYITWVKKVGT